MKNISVYVSYHNKCDLVKTNCFKPIQVGAAQSSLCYPGQLNDAEGEKNISAKNKSFCELTAQYWVWKNDKSSEYVGFYHYRRHLILNLKNKKKENMYGVVNYDHINESYLEEIGYSDEILQDFVRYADVIVPELWDVRHVGSQNNLDHFKRGKFLFVEDYYKCLLILKQKYPEYSQSIEVYNQSPYGYYTNIFIMKREVFEHYSQWLFNILFELEKDLDLSERNAQEYRVFGYLSEWLLGIYLNNLSAKENLQIVHCQRSFVEKTDIGKYSLFKLPDSLFVLNKATDIPPVIKTNFLKQVPVVTAFNENYAIAGAALLKSIIENSDVSCFYDVYIIEGDLSEETKFKFNLIVKKYKNFRLTIIDAEGYFQEKDLNLHAHFSKETYYRILIPSMLPQYDKVIYLDADMVVNEDIQILYDTDIGNCSIAAVKDYVMRGFIKFGTYCHSKCGSMKAYKYLKNYLNMNNPKDYVQAGVLILNTKKIIKSGMDKLIVEEMGKKFYWFLDQDLLNKFFEGDIHFLDTRWNVLNGNGNLESFFKKLPLPVMENYFEARKNPWIIHFAGEKKPWILPSVEFADIFFYYLRKTPWGSINFPSTSNFGEEQVHHQLKVFNIILKKIVNYFLPVGSYKRKICLKIYNTLKKIR
ncbi:hypothetical protein COMNV_01483 [Commensalibacter sp. Nvir]|uniref:DUF4422 domain-containing protein n=1 Tax=Commensalibacter sp. Nvir TaxID=3069817 RepID=UPI002D453330|nr:hypothetical protein COMNV_01483 [Commensalibacter sp. Nvir]